MLVMNTEYYKRGFSLNVQISINCGKFYGTSLSIRVNVTYSSDSLVLKQRNYFYTSWKKNYVY